MTKFFGNRVNEGMLFAAVTLLLLASLTALLFYVPILPLAFGLVILLGLILMFVFGFYLGTIQHSPPESRS